MKEIFVQKCRPFEKKNHQTTVMFGQLCNCANDNEFKEIFLGNADDIKKSNQAWRVEFTNAMVGQYLISNSKLADLCMTEEKIVTKWRNSAPTDREHYVALCCVFGLGAAICSRMMKRYGDFNELDENNLDDIVYIQLLNITERQDFNNTSKQIFYRDYKDKYFFFRDSFLKSDSAERTFARKNLEALKDYTFESNVYKAQKFHIPNLVAFYEWLNDFFTDTKYGSLSKFLTTAPSGNLSEMYRRRVLSEIHAETPTIIPKRKYILSLFLHMGLPLLTINNCLHIAGLEPLCSKVPFEAALIYTLSSISEEFPFLKNEDLMCSEQNKSLQESLPAGSVYMEVYKRLSTDFFQGYFSNEGTNLADCMCFNLVKPRKK